MLNYAELNVSTNNHIERIYTHDAWSRLSLKVLYARMKPDTSCSRGGTKGFASPSPTPWAGPYTCVHGAPCNSLAAAFSTLLTMGADLRLQRLLGAFHASFASRCLC